MDYPAASRAVKKCPAQGSAREICPNPCRREQPVHDAAVTSSAFLIVLDPIGQAYAFANARPFHPPLNLGI